MRRVLTTCFLAALKSFPKASFDAPLDTLETNVQGTSKPSVSEKIQSRFHYPCVCLIGGFYLEVKKEKLPIDEECTFHPASPYAISKVGTDLIGRFYAEAYGMKGNDDADVHPYWTAER